MNLRLGLCCLFKNEPVTFRTTTATALMKLERAQQHGKLSEICLSNAEQLVRAVQTAHRLTIGAFRIMSPLFPRMTHPDVGYSLDDLPQRDAIAGLLAETNRYARQHDIRLSFHPDQFVVLASPHQDVVANSIRELIYQNFLADLIGADVINIHVGGVYGDKEKALQRFCRVFETLPGNLRSRLTVENDDTSYTVRDLLPMCTTLAIPLVYDVHHHRCNPDGLPVEEATGMAGETWKQSGREQYCHLSSPKNGWSGADPKPHADYIDPNDFPTSWRERTMTIDIEAKAKELAVVQVLEYLTRSTTT
ncbi:UV DNA damage repair endonuclease UvsE [Desulfofustis limnaeus]|jgi:UV DNA damage endonuclease|uniref:UV DNA damage endonuclease n=1 Tax=Desulfofustis limnaeus TaxID=2740163 RepID=A0ABM7WCW9_9BACT|nr:UV DNA damage repair endonuclease UvsE [Desulfofustis limnaeus]MDX9895184.1 UV DNA damage repair endonuclease UvsE [Desulfofustis sp.]BDD88767.1 UV DNA damage endonuclease [Desulfofustis limnaeus]